MRQISRDPFARITIFRETVVCGDENCAWCGAANPHGKNGKWFLYRYYSQADGIKARLEPMAGGKLFCSIGCRRSYEQ